MNERREATWRRRTSGLALCFAAIWSVACTGVLGGSEEVLGSEAEEGTAGNQDGGDEPGANGEPVGTLTGVDGEQILYEPASTPLARLTNDEYFSSAVDALEIMSDAEGLAEARGTFAAEARVDGLPNDVRVQLLTQVAIEGYTNLASTAADVLLLGVESQAELKQRLGCSVATELGDCSLEYGQRLMKRAYRREILDVDLEQLEATVARFDEILQAEADDPSSLEADLLRIKTVIRMVLVSPDFLLIVERGAADAGVQTISPDEAASRLSYLLLGSPPDAPLRQAARDGRLDDAADRRAQAQRLLSSSEGRARIQSVMLGWLGVNENIVSPASVSALSEFIGDWFQEDKPFTDFYEAPIPLEHLEGGSSEEPVGVLGMDGFLGSHTFPPTPAFITRGVFLVERLLCAQLPADVPADALDSQEERTDLQVFEVHNKQPCATCHIYFDNYGAALHQFDAVTSLYQPQPTELGTGFELFGLDGISGVVDGPQDLAATLAASERAPRCMTELWYRNAMRRSLDAERDDDRVVDVLLQKWEASGDTSLRSLLLQLVSSEQFVAFVP